MYDADVVAPGATPEITVLFTSVLRKVQHSGARSDLARGIHGEQ